jgi:hypothetical protein
MRARPDDAPAEAGFARSRRNVELLLLDADAMAEHSPPDEVVGEMLWAAGLVAEANGLGASRFARIVAMALGHLLGADVLIELSPPKPKARPPKRRKA